MPSQSVSRRDFLSKSAKAAVALGLMGHIGDFAVPAAQAANKRPNIVVMVPHDLGWQDVGCFGNPACPTPHIDKLAAEGMRFDAAFVTAPLCSPSRASILTGRYPHSNGVNGLSNQKDWFTLPLAEKTLPEYLQAAGYRTARFGVWHVDHALDLRRCFDLDGGEIGNCRPTNAAGIQNQASFRTKFKSFVGQQSDKPFFVYYCPLSTHRPYPQVANPPFSPEKVWVPPFLPDNQAARMELSNYYTLVKWLDDSVGECMDMLEQAGVADNTLFCFLSDHGVAFPRAKSTLYDAGMKTPLIVRWPERIKAGSNYSGLVSGVDLLPTLLQVAGVPVPVNVQGQLIPPLVDVQAAPRDCVYAEKSWHDGYDPIRCIRTETFKYILNFELRPLLVLPGDFSGSTTALSMHGSYMAPRPEEELYNLKSDPWEKDNLADKPELAAIKTGLKQQLLNWMRDTDDPLLKGPVAAPPGLLRFYQEKGIVVNQRPVSH